MTRAIEDGTARSGPVTVDLDGVSVDPQALDRVPAALCRHHTLLPIGFDGPRLVVAMADPGDVFALDDVRAVSGLPILARRADPTELLAAIDLYHRLDTGLSDLAGLVPIASPGDGEAGHASGSPVVKFVDAVITQAVKDRASDIHIEPGEHVFRVRYRIDGVLHEVQQAPARTAARVVSHLKILADLDISERRVPQDGRLSHAVDGRRVNLRMATLPTVWGEKVVLRVLDDAAARLELAHLAFSPENLTRFSGSFGKPHGMVLVTGPTGSGKSTTLYATLNVISRPEVNVITVEDPVEYRLPGLNQVQVNPKAGLTFAGALRSILRSDPDIVLLGEIRDHETAHIAVEASLTGHLVLSTLHTNDAPSAITRLLEMGIEPYLVGSALECVLAQRLARRLCERCKEPYLPSAGEFVDGPFARWSGQSSGQSSSQSSSSGPPVLHRAVGCKACARTGFRGRVALHEVMTVSEQIERLAVARAPASEVGALARSEGMTTLLDDGLAKVVRGLTTIEEVLRVVA